VNQNERDMRVACKAVTRCLEETRKKVISKTIFLFYLFLFLYRHIFGHPDGTFAIGICS